MRFRLPTAVLTTAALVAAASAAGAGRPPAGVSVASCSVGDHSAAFYAHMKLVDGANRMALRFTLLERTGVEGDKPVKAPGLRRWHWSKPGVVSLRYRQGVRNLEQNATYRARVDFRWYSTTGAEVLRAQRLSPRCRQFVALPNLTAKITHVGPAKVPGVMRYESLVSNTGEATVDALPVRLTVDGDVVDTVSLALAPHEARTVVIRGPECQTVARVEADPEKAIAETSEADNASELTCTNPGRL
ncbi:MAG TPA: CARDB domain-containing protein [Thermoleophilaceae bacterium]|nr:CARDB domain-containing protein [Thermoleophilaceae bacterium]